MASLRTFRRLRSILIGCRSKWLKWKYGVDLHPSAQVSLSAQFYSREDGSITVGEQTLIAFRTLVTARGQNGSVSPVRIGRHCFIGGGCLIGPGVTIGEKCIVGAGSVVRDDIPANSIVGGNPARVLRSDVDILPYGILNEALAARQNEDRAR